MRTLKAGLFCACAILGAGQLAACATGPTERGTMRVIDDSSITSRVKTEIARNVGVDPALNVNVTTYRGVVQLSGFVDSRDAIVRAEQAARSVSGVAAVKNDLVLAGTVR